MAITASQSILYPSNLIWKNFIKETTVETTNIRNTSVSLLNFEGDEAKIVYEEIINNNNIVKSTDNRKKSKRELVCNINHVKCKKYTHNSQSEMKNPLIDVNKILKAVEQGNIQFLKENLTNKNVNIIDNYSWTPLMSAAYCGNELIVEFLLELGANKECKDKSGLTALHLAQKKNHLNIVQLLQAKKLKKKKKEINSTKYLEINEFYCSICKTIFKETTLKKHETSTLHIFNTNPKLPDPIYGIPTQNKGYQIMVNNGWEENKGLGPSGSGLKYPVKTVLKRDRKGFGHEPKSQARVTHFHSGDINAIRDVKQLKIHCDMKNSIRKRDRKKLIAQERKKEIAIRQALS